MIIGSNDIKASCRSMLISAKQAKSGGGGGGSGEIPIPDVPDPPSWEYPDEFWIAKPSSATTHHVTGVICVKKSSSNRDVTVSLWAASGSTSMGFMNWGDWTYQSIDVTSTSSGNVWGSLTHTYTAGTGHSIYIYDDEYEQWSFEVSLYNFDDYSDSNPVYFAGMYNTSSNISDRPSLQWVSIGDNIKMKANTAGQISSSTDQYRLFGREAKLEYVEIGSGCQSTIRAFEPVSGVTSQLKEVVLTGDHQISNYMFYNCKNLLKITGAEHINSIGAGAINYCSSLTKLICPNAYMTTSPIGITNMKLFFVNKYANQGHDLSICLFRQ